MLHSLLTSAFVLIIYAGFFLILLFFMIPFKYITVFPFFVSAFYLFHGVTFFIFRFEEALQVINKAIELRNDWGKVIFYF